MTTHTHTHLVSEKPQNRGKRRFLYGISMGGSVALLLHRKAPGYWDGAILLAPMCKVWGQSKIEMACFLSVPFSSRAFYCCG